MKVNPNNPQIKKFVEEMIQAKIPYLKDKYTQEEFMVLVIELIWKKKGEVMEIKTRDGNIVGARQTKLLKRILDYKRIYIIEELIDETN